MLGVGFLLVWAGYGVGSYGWCMVRGYDVPFRAWMSPLNPYQWPAGGPAPIPDSQLFPGSAAGLAPGISQPVKQAPPGFWSKIGAAANPFG
jgi:hypothetical protein